MSKNADDPANLSPVKRALLAVKDMRSRLEEAERARTAPIAIVGMACRFPGECDDPASFWKLLHDGASAVVDVPPDRWDVRALYDPDPEAPGKIYARRGSFVRDVDKFDTRFFGIPPREAMSMDPQQRMLLEVSWEALENAGLAPDRLAGTTTGVFVGISTNDYANLQVRSTELGQIDLYYGTGNAYCVAAGRIAYVLGLRGPTLAIDTACSSSLVAVSLAVQSLREERSRLALAGGVSLMVAPDSMIYSCRVRALAADGRSKTFDAAADGYGRGEGCGMVVLKRLPDALADGDRIHAVIRGTAVNHDGRSSGLTVPNGAAQREVLRAALADAGTEPGRIDYLEAHGTGTSLGDPIELRAVGDVLGAGRDRSRPLVVGAVKTNIGHLEAGAGIASLIKTVLALEHEEIPPHLNFETPSPHIPWDELPIVVPTRPVPWPRGELPRQAGVSSFGFSGTNAHVIVEEAPDRELPASERERPLHVLALSAKDEEALREIAARYAARLEGQAATALADVCFTAGTGRAHFEHRLAVIGESGSALAQALAAYGAGERSPGVTSGRVAEPSAPRIAFLFTGQGSQYPGMGRGLYESQPVFRETLDRCAEILDRYLDPGLLAILFAQDEPTASRLVETRFTQPALFALEYSLAELWRSWGIEPRAVTGHSVGEYVAACVAGVFDLEDGLRLIAERGRLMQSLPSGGRMAAVFADEDRVIRAIEPEAGSASLAAINGPRSVVVSGAGPAVQRVLERLEEQGVKSKPLSVSHAFHSPLMDPILDSFEETAAQLRLSDPSVALISNLTGREAQPGELVRPRYWRRHVREPVRFLQAMRSLAEQGTELFLEIGPSPTLLGMGRRCLPDSEGLWLPSLREGREDWRQILGSLAALYVRGVEVDWAGFDRPYRRRKLPLPTYPFRRQRFWFSGGRPAGAPVRKEPRLHPLVHRRLVSPALHETVFESELSAADPPFVADHRIHGTVVFPASGFVESVLCAADSAGFSGEPCIEGLSILEPLVLQPEESRTVQIILSDAEEDRVRFRVVGRERDEASPVAAWSEHVTGALAAAPSSGSPEGEGVVSSDLVSARCPVEQDVGAFYARFGTVGLDYGARFRAVERVWSGEREALGRLTLPGAVADEAGRFRIHPVLLDACFQLLAAVPSAGADADAADDLFLPTGFERFRVFRSGARRAWGHASVRAGEEARPEALTADLVLFDDEGGRIAEVEGLLLRRAPRDLLLRATRRPIDNWLYEPRWIERPRREERSAAGGAWVILADRGGVAEGLATRLVSAGNRCFLVHRGRGFSHTDSGRFEIDPGRPEHFLRLLAESIDRSDLPCVGLAHLWSLDRVNGEEMTAAGWEESGREICGSALSLVQAILQSGGSSSSELWFVTRGAHAVERSPAEVDLLGSSLWGLGRTVDVERPDLPCVRLDLDPDADAEAAAETLFREIEKTRQGENQIAWRGERRHVLRLARYRPAPETARAGDPGPVPPRADGAYLVTGGLGGLGLTVAEWLVERGARHLVLLGRGEPTAEARPALDRMERSGAELVVERADVSRIDQLRGVFDRIDRTKRKLRGVIHAAGVLDDAMLTGQSWRSFAAVMAPKALGSWNLHRLTRDRELDLFVLFSSVASLLGAPGQANYAAANAFMDALAVRRRSAGLTALSIGWGGWTDVGMAAVQGPELEERLSSQGIGMISPVEGLRALESLLAADATHVAVLPVNWPGLARRFEPDGGPPILADLLAEARKSASRAAGPGGPSPIRARLLAAGEKERPGLMTAYLSDAFARVLGLESSDAIDVGRPLSELGLDSLMAVELRNGIQSELNLAIPVDHFLEAPGISGLAEALLDLLSSEGPERTAGERSGVEDSGATDPDPRALLRNVDRLSDDEVQAALDRMFKNDRDGG